MIKADQKRRREHTLEFFLLDEIDRRVFFWLIDHVKVKAIYSWLEFIYQEYKRRNGVSLNINRLHQEAKEAFDK